MSIRKRIKQIKMKHKRIIKEHTKQKYKFFPIYSGYKITASYRDTYINLTLVRRLRKNSRELQVIDISIAD